VKPYYNDRPFYQLKVNHEFLLNEFNDAITKIQYPLHFIDFETCTMAVPFHKGMKPFQNVIFQWSCHTLYQDGRIEHSEWLNVSDYYPNFEFAKSLKKQIGNTGTVLTWSSYENTQLRAIKNTLKEDYSILRNEFVGPSVSGNIIIGAVYSVLFSLLGIFLYLWFRFDWQYGIMGVITLIHDCIMGLGFLSIFRF
jgi:hypothetical protein